MKSMKTIYMDTRLAEAIQVKAMTAGISFSKYVEAQLAKLLDVEIESTRMKVDSEAVYAEYILYLKTPDDKGNYPIVQYKDWLKMRAIP